MSAFSDWNGPAGGCGPSLPGVKVLQDLLHDLSQLQTKLANLSTTLDDHKADTAIQQNVHHVQELVTRETNTLNNTIMAIVNTKTTISEVRSQLNVPAGKTVATMIQEETIRSQQAESNLATGLSDETKAREDHDDDLLDKIRELHSQLDDVIFNGEIKLSKVKEFTLNAGTVFENMARFNSKLKVAYEIEFVAWKKTAAIMVSCINHNKEVVALLGTLDDEFDGVTADDGQRVKSGIAFLKQVDTSAGRWDAMVTMTATPSFGPGANEYTNSRGSFYSTYSATKDTTIPGFGLYVSSNVNGKKKVYLGVTGSDITIGAILVDPTGNGSRQSFDIYVAGINFKPLVPEDYPNSSVWRIPDGQGFYQSSRFLSDKYLDASGHGVAVTDEDNNTLTIGDVVKQHELILASGKRPVINVAGTIEYMAYLSDIAGAIKWEGSLDDDELYGIDYTQSADIGVVVETNRPNPQRPGDKTLASLGTSIKVGADPTDVIDFKKWDRALVKNYYDSSTQMDMGYPALFQITDNPGDPTFPTWELAKNAATGNPIFLDAAGLDDPDMSYAHEWFGYRHDIGGDPANPKDLYWSQSYILYTNSNPNDPTIPAYSKPRWSYVDLPLEAYRTSRAQDIIDKSNLAFESTQADYAENKSTVEYNIPFKPVEIRPNPAYIQHRPWTGTRLLTAGTFATPLTDTKWIVHGGNFTGLKGQKRKAANGPTLGAGQWTDSYGGNVIMQQWHGVLSDMPPDPPSIAEYNWTFRWAYTTDTTGMRIPLSDALYFHDDVKNWKFIPIESWGTPQVLHDFVVSTSASALSEVKFSAKGTDFALTPPTPYAQEFVLKSLAIPAGSVGAGEDYLHFEASTTANTVDISSPAIDALNKATMKWDDYRFGVVRNIEIPLQPVAASMFTMYQIHKDLSDGTGAVPADVRYELIVMTDGSVTSGKDTLQFAYITKVPGQVFQLEITSPRMDAIEATAKQLDDDTMKWNDYRFGVVRNIEIESQAIAASSLKLKQIHKDLSDSTGAVPADVTYDLTILSDANTGGTDSLQFVYEETSPGSGSFELGISSPRMDEIESNVTSLKNNVMFWGNYQFDVVSELVLQDTASESITVTKTFQMLSDSSGGVPSTTSVDVKFETEVVASAETLKFEYDRANDPFLVKITSPRMFAVETKLSTHASDTDVHFISAAEHDDTKIAVSDVQGAVGASTDSLIRVPALPSVPPAAGMNWVLSYDEAAGVVAWIEK